MDSDLARAGQGRTNLRSGQKQIAQNENVFIFFHVHFVVTSARAAFRNCGKDTRCSGKKSAGQARSTRLAGAKAASDDFRAQCPKRPPWSPRQPLGINEEGPRASNPFCRPCFPARKAWGNGLGRRSSSEGYRPQGPRPTTFGPNAQGACSGARRNPWAEMKRAEEPPSPSAAPAAPRWQEGPEERAEEQASLPRPPHRPQRSKATLPGIDPNLGSRLNDSHVGETLYMGQDQFLGSGRTSQDLCVCPPGQ